MDRGLSWRVNVNMFPSWPFDLASWWPSHAAAKHHHIVLYTRQGCHLCELAKQQLETTRHRRPFSLEAVDVDSQPELAARYGSLVPVVTVNGRVRFWGRVNPVLLDR